MSKYTELAERIKAYRSNNLPFPYQRIDRPPAVQPVYALRQDHVFELFNAIEALVTERDKLQKALEEIKSLSKSHTFHPMDGEADYFCIAHAALTKQ